VAHDVPAKDDIVHATDRIAYLRAYLTQLQHATGGVPIKCYFHGSPMDNFEWMAGYGNRFGVVHVDFKRPNARRRRARAGFGGRAAQRGGLRTACRDLG